MTLLSDQHYRQLRRNGEDFSADHPPVAKLYIPSTKHVWLVSSLYCVRRNIAWGLFTLYADLPIPGFIDLDELVQGTYGADVQVDPGFTGTHPLSVYTRAAIAHGRIVEDKTLLNQFRI